MTPEEWQAEGTRLFGSDVNTWRFMCPSCGHVQTRQDFIDLGLNMRQVDELLAYSCIGRWLDPMGAVDAFEDSTGSGCRYLGGLNPNISPIKIELHDGRTRQTFGFAVRLQDLER